MLTHACNTHTQPTHRYGLNVCDAPEPSDVKYENIEHGSLDRGWRRLVTSALQYLSLAVGFVLISMASAMRVNQEGIAGVDRGSCNASCDYKVCVCVCLRVALAVCKPLQLRILPCFNVSAGLDSTGRRVQKPDARIAHTQQNAAGTLELSAANRDLYQACGFTKHKPGGVPCTPGEVVCYRCWCFEAISAGMLK